MLRHLALLILALTTVVNAHFQLQYPPPRGVFVEDDEPTFCDGYKTPASNRSEFPLTGGFFTLNSEHPQWTAGVIVAGTQDPTSFSNFSQVVPFFQTEGEGLFCIPLDFSANANGTALKDGQNVTIQIVYNGGDGNLYQCADLTLSSNFKISADVKCSNATNTPAAANSTGSSTTAAPAATHSSGADELTVGAVGLMLSVLGTFLTL